MHILGRSFKLRGQVLFFLLEMDNLLLVALLCFSNVNLQCFHLGLPLFLGLLSSCPEVLNFLVSALQFRLEAGGLIL